MRKALQRLVFYALLLPVFISSAAFAPTSPVYSVNGTPKDFEVDSLAPKKGPAWGGTTITIYGKKFLPNTKFEIRFGGIAGTKVARVSNEVLTVKLPRHPLSIKNADTIEVTVTDLDETPNVTKVSPDSFIYVRPGTKLSLLPAAAVYNGMVELNATLADSSNNPIDSQTVTFTLNGLIAGTAMTDTSGSGKLTTSISGVEPGVHTGYIGASFAENIFYKASTALPADLTVKPLSPSLIINSPVVSYGESIELKAVLTSSGVPMSGKTISFSLNNNPAGTAVTGADGSASFLLSPSPDAGTHSIKAEFAEAGYDPASASGTLTVKQAATSLSVSNAESDGGTVTLRARLTSNVTGLGIPNDTISFSFTGGSYAGFAVTDQNGVAEIPGGIVPDNLGPGLHKGAVKASFNGSRDYIASSGSGDLTVNITNTVLSVSSATGTYGGSVSLKAKLKSGGSNLSGKTIKFYLNDAPAGQSSTGSDGIANYKAPLGTIDAGTYPEGIKAVYEGSDNYGSDTSTNSLKVNQAPTSLKAVSLEASYGSTVTLSATLTSDVTQAGIPGKTITFTIQGGPEAAASTDANGTASASVKLGSLSAGMHDILAGFSPSGGNYKGSTGKGKLTVKEFTASLTVTNATGPYGGNVTLEAVLKKSTGEGLEGKTIKFTFNNKTYSVATNSSGAASVKGVSIAGFNAGTYPGVIVAEFSASDGYPSVSASGSLTVERASTAIAVTNVTAAFKGKADLSAKLTSGDSPLDGVIIKFTLNGTPAGEAQTNGLGVATLYNISLPAELGPGTYTGAIGASFEESTNYASSSGTGNLTINQAAAVIQVTNASGPYGGRVSLLAKLTNSSGAPLTGQKLHFKLKGTDINDAITDGSGLASIPDVSIAGIDAGIYDNYIEVSYSPADNSYAQVKAFGKLEVTRAATSLLVSNVQAYFGSTITLTARLTSNVTNLGIENRTIVFKIDGNEIGAGVTGPDGKAYADYYMGSTSAGSHTIDAYYSPSGGNYMGSTGKGILTVNAVSTTLVVTTASGIYGGAVTLEAKLTSSGNALKDKTVKFTFNNKTYSASTNASGAAQVGGVSISGFSVGEYPGEIQAEFAGMDGYAYSLAYGKLTVLPAPAAVLVTSTTGVFGGTVDLSAILTSGGIPLSGRTLSFKLNGAYVGNASTESDGRATLQGVSLSGINAGYYKDIIAVSFTASGNYSAASASGNLTVTQVPTVVTVSKATGLYNGKVSLKATLTTASGSPVSGKTISFKLNGKDEGSALTDNNGAAVLADVSIAGIAAGTYNNYIEAGFNPSGGNYAASTGKGQLEVSLAQTNIAVNKVTAVYGSKVTLTATLTSQGAPLSGRTVEFLLDDVSVGSALTDQKGVASKANVDLSGIGAGLYIGYIRAVFAESNPYKGCSNKADLEITKASTAVLVLPAEVQYSDQVTLTAVVKSVSAQVFLNAAGGSVEFRYQVENETAKLLAAVTSFSIVDGSLSFSYTFACTLAPGTYKIIAAFTPAAKNNFDGSCSLAPWGPLIVKTEDALIEFTGPRYFATPSLTDFNTSLNFCATLTDLPDASRGNITKAEVEFREVAIDGSFDNGILRGKDIPVLLLNQSDVTIGTAASPSFKRNLSQAEINNEGATFYVYTSAGGFYYKLSDPALVTIAIPGESNISGGGFIIPNSSAGKYLSQTGTKTCFGFSMKYNTSGSNFPGQTNIVIQGENNKIYLIKSSLISSVSAYTIKNMPGKAASLSAKADLKDITDPRNTVILAAGLSLSLEVYDDDKNNENDALAITLRDNNSVLLYSSNWDGSKTISQTLSAPKGGGIIRVLSSSGPVSVEGKEIMPKEYALYQNFPNPFNPSTNIQFDLPEDSRVNISIYNILGRVVARLVDKDFTAGRHLAVWNSQDGGSYASGMYILRITAKSNISQRSLVSTKKMMLVK